MKTSLHNRNLRGSANGAIVGIIIAVVIFGVMSRFIGSAQLEKLQALETQVASSTGQPVILPGIDRGTCGYLVPDVSERIMSVIVCPSCATLAGELHNKYEITLQERDSCTRGPYNTLQFAAKQP